MLFILLSAMLVHQSLSGDSIPELRHETDESARGLERIRNIFKIKRSSQPCNWKRSQYRSRFLYPDEETSQMRESALNLIEQRRQKNIKFWADFSKKIVSEQPPKGTNVQTNALSFYNHFGQSYIKF